MELSKQVCMDCKPLELKVTWLSPGSYSRYKTWTYAELMLGNWLKQKGYKIDLVKQCKSFAKENGFNGSHTDNLIIAHQNFKLFREFVNKEYNP